MAGALFSLSAGGVMFATAVVIIIFSAMGTVANSRW